MHISTSISNGYLEYPLSELRHRRYVDERRGDRNAREYILTQEGMKVAEAAKVLQERIANPDKK